MRQIEKTGKKKREREKRRSQESLRERVRRKKERKMPPPNYGIFLSKGPHAVVFTNFEVSSFRSLRPVRAASSRRISRLSLMKRFC